MRPNAYSLIREILFGSVKSVSRFFLSYLGRPFAALPPVVNYVKDIQKVRMIIMAKKPLFKQKPEAPGTPGKAQDFKRKGKPNLPKPAAKPEE